MLKNKNILLGICGGIAAYKTPLLVRLLKKAGANVQVLVTPSALDFVTAPTLSVLSEKEVLSDFWQSSSGNWNNHVELGLWADLMLIAPLTANTASKMANGACDNLLLATYLSMRNKTMVAPAMDLDMFAHPATKQNLTVLNENGVIILDAETGPLASGLEGKGRMMEPENIFAAIQNYFKPIHSFKGKKVLITAGPTYEKLDPVRFIGNFSTGKMGIALARVFAESGAEVQLIYGPGAEEIPEQVHLTKVTSADEMLTACAKHSDADIAIFSAAVADYKPAQIATQKIKKTAEEDLTLHLVKNPDILKWYGQQKKSGQFVVGFALETENELENAQKKRSLKNADLILLNSLNDQDAGFGKDTNKITIIDENNKILELKTDTKYNVSKEIASYIWKKIQSVS